MSKRLSKISKELHIGISVIVDFLKKNGYSCEEDPSEKIDEDIVDFIYSNIIGYLSSKGSDDKVLNQKKNIHQDASDKMPIPLELRIIDAASQNKKLIERIIGFTDYYWHYTITKFRGICSQPVKFNLFDETICAILLKGEISAKEIGQIIGLDFEKDPAERSILLTAINELKKDQMVDGDESVLWLTDIGKEYAKNGVKFSTFERDFDLYIDATGNLKERAKEVFRNLTSEKQDTFRKENLPQNIEDVKPLAEWQAPEIHFPKEQYILQSCEPKGIEGYKAKVWVVLLENFRDQTIRSLVYDEKQDKIIEPLSVAFDQLEDEKNLIFNKLITESYDDDFSVELTTDEKQNIQIEQEAELIKKQEEFDIAISNNEVEKITAIQKDVYEIKRHFNSLEFQVELKRLFYETSDELWIISPWIKKYATLRRVPFFENYLKKGGRIFVAYSLPEKDGETMADEEALNMLLELENKYHNFYLHQLPAFHYKRVWLKSNSGKNVYYTGSYNILSFFVKQDQKNYRQEEMSRLDWNSENDSEYNNLLLQFGEKYFNKAVVETNQLTQTKETINKEFLQKIKGLNYGKLKCFLSKGLDVFDEKYKELESIKEEQLDYFKHIYYTNELQKLAENMKATKSRTLSSEKKKEFQSKLNIISNEYPKIMSASLFEETQIALNSLKVFAPINNSSKSKIKKRK